VSRIYVSALLAIFSISASAATFTVTNTSDSGPGSLRDAIALANAAPGTDTINFTVTGTITVTSGVLRITSPMTIVGPGAASLAIDGNADRLLAISEDPATSPACPALTAPADYLVTISGLTLQNGRRNTEATGGAIVAAHSVVLDSVIIRDSIAKQGGGVSFLAQYPNQSLTITNSQFINNIAKPLSAITGGQDSGGGLFIGENCNARTTPVAVSISNSLFTGNQVQPVTLSGYGGAINTFSDANITITDTRIVGNSVVPPSPPVTGAQYFGGGVYGRSKSVRIERSEISDNTAVLGGGLRFFNDIASDQSPATALAVKLVNSTVSGNAVTTTGGGIDVFGNVALEADNSTISANSSPTGNTGGIRVGIGNTSPVGATTTPPTVTLVSSIVAGNIGGGVDIGAGNVASLVVNATQSLVGVLGTNVTVTAGNLTGVAPQLGPLAFNGGNTRTQAILPGSPAIDAGSNPLGLTTDQRGTGFPRTINGGTDIGAYESALTPIPPPPSTTAFIPTLSEYALALLALLLAGMSAFFIRRRT
jgi:IPTL-CTERM motif